MYVNHTNNEKMKDIETNKKFISEAIKKLLNDLSAFKQKQIVDFRLKIEFL